MNDTGTWLIVVLLVLHLYIRLVLKDIFRR